ncbi:hypothetical protein [Castellaniella sp.]|uniref:YdcA family protein n=1 Tax=Castellaniella sp. TaxID=1955812 RepID=UPI003A4C675E
MLGFGNDVIRLATALCLLLACTIFSLTANAANQPCSGRKGGVSHCQGETFVCNDGSVSASKRSCNASPASGSNFAPAPAKRSAVPSAGESSCSCRAGAYCTGPRGGRYCYSDSGRKSYLRK